MRAPFSVAFVFVLIGAFLLSLILTPFVRFLAFRVGAVDQPNARRINKVPMPSSGGLAIVISFLFSALFLMPKVTTYNVWHQSYFEFILPVAVSGLIITLTGFVDDIKELSPKAKLLGIVIAATIIWYFTDFRFDSFKIPFGGPLLEFGPFLTFFLTILWIVGITNAVNLMDGLDGLVSGVSIISLMTMGLVSFFFYHKLIYF